MKDLIIGFAGGICAVHLFGYGEVPTPILVACAVFSVVAAVS